VLAGSIALRTSAQPGNSMAKIRTSGKEVSPKVLANMIDVLPLWQLDIGELTGHNLEAHGREEVNRLLEAGWRLLHIYTLKYQENGVWRERPMAILGKLRSLGQEEIREEGIST
jgi:FtsZ-binding cell division protein ZapB